MKKLFPLLVFIISMTIVIIAINQLKINFIDVNKINIYKADEHELTLYRTISHDDIIKLLIHSFNESKRVKEIPNIEGSSFYVTFEYESGRKKTFYLCISKDEEYAFYTKKKNTTQGYKISEINTKVLKVFLGLQNY